MMQDKPKRFANWNIKVPKDNSKKKKIIIAAAGIIIVIALILSGIFFPWGKDKYKKISNVIAAKAKEKEKPPLPTKPEMKAVQLEPKAPTSLDFVHALPILKYPDMEYVNYSYQWYVNGDAVSAPDGQRSTLDRTNYKKGDKVYCRVKAVRGKVEVEPMESNSVKIGNSAPVLKFVSVKPFDVPGEFQYNIEAADPDGDLLTYRLLAPLDRGITIDGKTGLMKWYITEAPVTESMDQPAYLPENESAPAAAESSKEAEQDSSATPTSIAIIYEVSDSENASVKGSITLDLTKGCELRR